MAIQYIDDARSDGTVLGQNATTAKIGFFGLTTPIVQPTSANQATITTGATTTATITLLVELRNQLVNLGLIKGA